MFVPEIVPGATNFSLSAAEFQDLRAGRPFELSSYSAYGYYRDKQLFRIRWQTKSQLSRVEPDDLPYSIIVNGERRDIPVIHVRGPAHWVKGRNVDLVDEENILDDPGNPIVLSFLMTEANSHKRLGSDKFLKIDFPVEKKIEQDLANTGHTEVYGIYFDFGIAKIRPESERVLTEIANALKSNSDWKIAIGGHTDNIGGDRYNVDLSQRRAEAVRQALVSEFQISPDRLTAAGYGASQPKASNDTAEGRALNRRVELVRK
jgi:outer membrane protein OmpA-like peptidoglycan-associated protein